MVGTRVEGASNRFSCDAVARCPFADRMRLINGGAHLLNRIGGELRVRADRATPRSHDLDEVRTLLEQQARRRTHRVRPIHLAAEVAAMPTGYRERIAAEDEPGAGHDPGADRVAQPEHEIALAAAIADRCHAGMERGTRVGVRLQEEQFVRQRHPCREWRAVPRQHRMGVRVDQPRHDCAIAEIEDRRAAWRLARRINARDDAAFDRHDDIALRLRPRSINQPSRPHDRHAVLIDSAHFRPRIRVDTDTDKQLLGTQPRAS